MNVYSIVTKRPVFQCTQYTLLVPDSIRVPYWLAQEIRFYSRTCHPYAQAIATGYALRWYRYKAQTLEEPQAARTYTKHYVELIEWVASWAQQWCNDTVESALENLRDWETRLDEWLVNIFRLDKDPDHHQEQLYNLCVARDELESVLAAASMYMTLSQIDEFIAVDDFTVKSIKGVKIPRMSCMERFHFVRKQHPTAWWGVHPSQTHYDQAL